MAKIRRFQIDELLLRPGTYFNPQTEVMVVVDDSPEVDNELFEGDSIEEDEWVLIAEETPVDERRRDDLIESFQQTHTEGTQLTDEDDLGDDDDEPGLEPDELEEDEELEEVEEL
jgi:hypothetical protein